MNFLSKDYLPNSEERIACLRKIINGRPVAILAAGPSIRELEERIGGLRDADICYFGFSNFFIQEAHILEKINRRFSLVFYAVRPSLPLVIKQIISFLDRAEDNMFVSTFFNDTYGLLDSSFNLAQFLAKYDKKLIFFGLDSRRIVPNNNYPLHFILSNTLLGLIQIALIGKASSIVLFGADGYCEDNVEEYYYRKNEYVIGEWPLLKWGLKNDTNRYFNPIAAIAIRNTCKTYELTPIDILNCSEKSFYTPFPKVSYDNAFEYLLKERKFNIKLDLRIPKISVITLCINNKNYIKEVVENVLKQSYSSYEHILVCDEIDDKTQQAIEQFPRLRLISEKNIDFLQALKKAVSLAKGEYILYLRMGDGYLNQDWLNTCVEALENNSEISLVWGLSQYMLEDGALGQIPNARLFSDPPAQGKNYIYYWLKRKTIFPEGSLCVRKSVLEECFPFADSEMNNEYAGWLTFNYRFNASGYLPYFISVVVNYSKQRITLDTRNFINLYYTHIKDYQRKLFIGRAIHRYMDGSGKLLAGGFSRGIFIFFDIARQVKSTIFNLAIRVKAKLPKVCCAIIDKILFFWRAYKWNAFKVALVRIWFRLTNQD